MNYNNYDIDVNDYYSYSHLNNQTNNHINNTNNTNIINELLSEIDIKDIKDIDNDNDNVDYINYIDNINDDIKNIDDIIDIFKKLEDEEEKEKEKENKKRIDFELRNKKNEEIIKFNDNILNVFGFESYIENLLKMNIKISFEIFFNKYFHFDKQNVYCFKKFLLDIEKRNDFCITEDMLILFNIIKKTSDVINLIIFESLIQDKDYILIEEIHTLNNKYKQKNYNVLKKKYLFNVNTFKKILYNSKDQELYISFYNELNNVYKLYESYLKNFE